MPYSCAKSKAVWPSHLIELGSITGDLAPCLFVHVFDQLERPLPSSGCCCCNTRCKRTSKISRRPPDDMLIELITTINTHIQADEWISSPKMNACHSPRCLATTSGPERRWPGWDDVTLSRAICQLSSILRAWILPLFGGACRAERCSNVPKNETHRPLLIK